MWMLTLFRYLAGMAPPPLHLRSPSRLAGIFALAVAVVATIPLAALLARDGAAPFTVVESGRGFATLQQAVEAIGTGRGTIRIAPGTYRDCAVQDDGFVRYEAAEAGTVIFRGGICNGKAALVLDGVGAEVVGLVFAEMAVPDGNGAGIRLQEGTLAVSQSWFRDSQQGILTANGRRSRITIDKSTFTRLGTCENSSGCAHSLYIGDYGELVVTRSRFEQGTGGHYLKSRASRNTILDNSFDDSKGRGTNYHIDLPEGGSGEISGNWFVQGPDKENASALIAVGAEDPVYSADGLVIEGNDARLAPGQRSRPAFVADWTGDRLAIGRNSLAPGITPFERR